MKHEFIIKKCKACDTMVKVLQKCNDEGCDIICCGEPMQTLLPNSVDAAVEKHVPTYEKHGDEIVVRVNHVMEQDHYIEWICMVNDTTECMVTLCPGQTPEVRFPYRANSTLYAYCNKHGLWKTEVE